jgi:hypothetical protein
MIVEVFLPAETILMIMGVMIEDELEWAGQEGNWSTGVFWEFHFVRKQKGPPT